MTNAKTTFDKVKKEVFKILPNSPINFELRHTKLVLKWLLKLKPDADDALKIAAFSHDMERAITKITEKDLEDYSKINEFKKAHSIRSAKFICEILEKHSFEKQFVEKVKHLVENHEFGGDYETNILMNADSLAYFDYNIPHYLKRNGVERTKQKIGFMYKRLSLNAQKLVKKINFSDKETKILVEECITEIGK